LKKLAVITTHPIQYYAPVFKLLAKQVKLKVFYSGGEQLVNQFDRSFKKHITWDISLLDGYDYEFLTNTAKHPGSHHFTGIKNLDIIPKINSYQPNAILIYGWGYQSHLSILRYFKGKIPIYFRGDSTLLDHKGKFKTLLRTLFLRWVYSHINIAFYVGKANKDYFKAHGLKEHQLIFAPHAIDNERFAENRIFEANQLRYDLKIKETDILLLFAGKLEPKKNPELLLNAFLTLNNKNMHLLYVGNGVLEENLKTKSKGIKNIHFISFQNQTQMPIVYQACDLFCLPSKGPGETWGLAVNEAMASAKPVLVSDKVGCAIDLVQTETGCTFISEDLTDLTQKLIALTKDKNELKKMGENSLKHIQNWSFEEQVNTIANYVNR